MRKVLVTCLVVMSLSAPGVASGGSSLDLSARADEMAATAELILRRFGKMSQVTNEVLSLVLSATVAAIDLGDACKELVEEGIEKDRNSKCVESMEVVYRRLRALSKILQTVRRFDRLEESLTRLLLEKRDDFRLELDNESDRRMDQEVRSQE